MHVHMRVYRYTINTDVVFHTVTRCCLGMSCYIQHMHAFRYNTHTFVHVHTTTRCCSGGMSCASRLMIERTMRSSISSPNVFCQMKSAGSHTKHLHLVENSKHRLRACCTFPYQRADADVPCCSWGLSTYRRVVLLLRDT